MEHTIQRRTVTSQRLGGLVGPRSIARPSVLLYAVSPRVLPEAVTQGSLKTEEHAKGYWRRDVGIVFSLTPINGLGLPLLPFFPCYPSP